MSTPYVADLHMPACPGTVPMMRSSAARSKLRRRERETPKVAVLVQGKAYASTS